MTNDLDPLILDMLEWIAREPRRYEDVLEAWRTSCPRLTVWEDACDRALVERKPAATGTRIIVSAAGLAFLKANGRLAARRPHAASPVRIAV